MEKELRNTISELRRKRATYKMQHKNITDKLANVEKVLEEAEIEYFLFRNDPYPFEIGQELEVIYFGEWYRGTLRLAKTKDNDWEPRYAFVVELPEVKHMSSRTPIPIKMKVSSCCREIMED